MQGNRFIILVASVGYIGYLPFAPGTAGTLAGIPVFLLFSSFPKLNYLLGTAAIFFLGWWTAQRAEILFKQRDSPKIVIDELGGYLIAMAFLPVTLTTIVGGFLFFRLLDIMKPFPLRWIDRCLKGGLAVVLDDAAAGLMVNLFFQIPAYWDPQILFFLDRWIFRA